MVIPMYNTKGKKVGEVELRSDIFEVPVNVPLMHQALVRQLANARLGTHKTKSRGEVIRTKAKWYRQKGTGRARHGSRNANLFVGGGIAHGPRPRLFAIRMNGTVSGLRPIMWAIAASAATPLSDAKITPIFLSSEQFGPLPSIPTTASTI